MNITFPNKIKIKYFTYIISIIVFFFLFLGTKVYGVDYPLHPVEKGVVKYIKEKDFKTFAVAIDLDKRFVFGYSYGEENQNLADKKAFEICNKYKEEHNIKAKCKAFFHGDKYNKKNYLTFISIIKNPNKLFRNSTRKDLYEAGYLLNLEIEKDNKKRDYTKVLEFYKKSCEEGYGKACYSLANKYSEGMGVKKNIKTAIKYHEKAFDFNYPLGYVELGRIYSKGKVVKKDIPKAKVYYQKACDAGEKYNACLMLKYVDKPKRQENALNTSIDTLKKQCNNDKKNNPFICTSLGNIFRNNNEFINAIKYYERACKVFTTDCISLGKIYINKKFKGYDEDRAISYFEKTCDKGNAIGCIKAGSVYQNLIKDSTKSKIFYKRACFLGYKDYCNI